MYEDPVRCMDQLHVARESLQAFGSRLYVSGLSDRHAGRGHDGNTHAPLISLADRSSSDHLGYQTLGAFQLGPFQRDGISKSRRQRTTPVEPGPSRASSAAVTSIRLSIEGAPGESTSPSVPRALIANVCKTDSRRSATLRWPAATANRDLGNAQTMALGRSHGAEAETLSQLCGKSHQDAWRLHHIESRDHRLGNPQRRYSVGGMGPPRLRGFMYGPAACRKRESAGFRKSLICIRPI